MDILFYQTVLGFKASECDSRNAQDPAFPGSEFDNTCIRLKAIIELLQLKADGKRLGYGGDIDQAIEQLMTEQWWVAEGDSHPDNLPDLN